MRQDSDDSFDFDQFLFELSAAQRVIALISLAYLEEDGLPLSIALLAAVIVLTVALVVFLGDSARRKMDLWTLAY